MRLAPVALIASCSALALLAACSSTPSKPVQAAAPASAPTAMASSPAQTSGAGQDNANAGKLGANNGAGAKAAFNPSSQSVFFQFDDATVAADAQSLLQQDTQWLHDNGQSHLTLQGNCDERGGREYNLALGQRRADAVRKAMGLLGAPADRIDTVSFGKEKPRATCHEESCWKDNRRVDAVATAAH